MPSILAALMTFAAYVPATLVLHVAISRLSRTDERRPPQGAAANAANLVTLIFTAATAFLTWDRPDFAPMLVYTALGCGLMGYIYFLMFCNSESGRRYHVLRLLLKHGAMDYQQLRAVYSPKHIIQVRLERLLQWRVITEVNGGLQVRKRGPVWVSYVFYLWSRVLGFRWTP